MLSGPPGQPGWARPGLLVLLATTAVLYLWELSASGYANSYYAAAAQAGSRSWTALLFGSLDAGNAITVDKPPASLWVMGLSARIFGFSSWSVLAPQAVEGVATVALLYAAVRRRFGPGAGLLAGAGLALTPVSVLMFRYDHPDALLVLLLVAGGYCVLRATERASAGWLALAGTALGFAFLTKMLQGFLVLPAFGLVYLVAAPAPLLRRLWHLLAATAAMVVSAGWYVALVAVWPVSSRPYIGGSSDNSLLELALGYNGLGRLFGGGGGGGGQGGNTNTSFGGPTGVTRLFGDALGAEVSWLLPAALIALLAGLWFTRDAPRTDPTRAALLLWGGWLVVTGVVFSFMSGTFHPYYTVALAPAIAALVAIGGGELWRARTVHAPRAALAGMVAVTGMWSFLLLARTPEWLPGLRWAVLVGSGVATIIVFLGGGVLRRAGGPVAVGLVLAGLAGPAAYAVATAATTHAGSLPASGPVSGGSGSRAGGPGSAGGTGMPAGGQPGGSQSEDSAGELAELLAATTTRWAAAISGATSAADLELSSGKAVIALGGWNGGDPSPTLAEFQRYVNDGQIRYFVTGGDGRGGGPGGSGGSGGGTSATSEITSWVQETFQSTTVGGQTVYDLTQSAVS
ncbi:MAG: glycosyltransferase family 39 protein [Dactylosporangium sp.]|nr:glycosyltransferase family 39 protein [Dactylosporangium sp.]